jgi:glycerol-1-phosphate dehydrogenase [NAD(P)+]
MQENCKCGKKHIFSSRVIVGDGVLGQLPELLKGYHAKKVYLIADQNTYQAAGKTVWEILDKNDIQIASCIFQEDALEPDEHSVGRAIMYYESNCDVVIGVGSGVINDIGKIVANVSGKPYIIVATAPSMDGYASATSSMARDGLKISLNSKCADVIMAELDVLCQAPAKMMASGLGDMLAKYVSICEWRIANLITGEYYCEDIAQLVRDALKRCSDHAEGLLKRDKEAVKAVFEGLVIGGVAMAYAGVSRPASGVEHYFSHVWDMRGVEFGTPVDFHGIQCAMATYHAIRLYEAVKKQKPDYEKASAYVSAFDQSAWEQTLREFLGKSAEAMIALEKKEGKYRKETHAARFRIIAENWDRILQIMDEELPSAEEIAKLLAMVGIPTDLSAIGVDTQCARTTFQATKDIRDKYVLSRLAWDLGILDELAEQIG